MYNRTFVLFLRLFLYTFITIFAIMSEKTNCRGSIYVMFFKTYWNKPISDQSQAIAEIK